MIAPQGIARFPGITQLVRCSLAMGHGICPSTMTLNIAPQENFPAEGGTLTIEFDKVRYDFPGCKIDRHSLQRNSQGLVWQLSLLDRRWKWSWGEISGHYNLRNDDGSLQTNTEKTPRQLASLCLAAMGETDFDVSRLPNDARPLREWNVEVPAQALAGLCDELGCRVVLRLDNRVSIEVVGGGKSLPQDDSVTDDSQGLDPPERPDSIVVLCGSNRYQVDLPLEAVGLDSDDRWRLLDDLSYKPADGWYIFDQYHMAVQPSMRERAKSTVYRSYRIKLPAVIPGYGEITSLDGILPLEDSQVTAVPLDEGSDEFDFVSKPVQVYGRFCLLKEGLANSVEPFRIDPNAFETKKQEYLKDFSFDRTLGLVHFEEPVFLNESDNGNYLPEDIRCAPAQLYLRVACQVRDTERRIPARHQRKRDFGDQFGTLALYLNHPEITLVHVPEYDMQFKVVKLATSATQVNSQCDFYLDQAENEYQPRAARTVSYTGLRNDVELDGAIQQIVLEVGPSGATTSISYNDEQTHRHPSYRQQRQLTGLRALPKLNDYATPTALRRNLGQRRYAIPE